MIQGRSFPPHRMLFSLCLLVLLLTGCTRPAPASTATPAPLPTANLPAGIDEIRQIWSESPHGNTYALEKGPNTYCARCHAPHNWDINSAIDDPPNCVSCKFPNEPEMRMAASNPLVPEEDWRDIECEVCHRLENGIAVAETSWMNRKTGFHESVSDPTELCEKCHLSNGILTHKRERSGVHESLTCTECHDAHSTSASCTACHEIDMTQAYTAQGDNQDSPAHTEVHVMVSCEACHDSSGLEVAPIEDEGIWMPMRTTEFFGRYSTDPYRSHSLQQGTDCSKCHFLDNPWGLEEILDE